ncbi:MAG: pirin family protein, partial [Nocardioidaceae bacterium]|nr:pirin family protein [Nocardioidaceae bacterium]
AFEHGALVDTGSLTVVETEANAGDLIYVPTGHEEITLVAGPDGARLLLLGGPPFGEAIVMWWNFVGRTHEDIVAYRAAWQAQITDADTGTLIKDSRHVAQGRFGVVPEQPLPPIPAPALPNARLRERR